MTLEIAQKLKTKLRDMVRVGLSQIEDADYDEVKILHSRAKESFPSEFNVLIGKLAVGAYGSNYEICKRLLRILQVIESLPIELQDISMANTTLPDQLIPMFELKRPDKDRIFELCGDMRKIVFAATDFDQPHRLRLLNRIAAIEAETHKPKGIFDVVRGGISDLGETLGKFGKDIKPLTDRMAEVVKIARSGTKEYDQLPPPDEVKQLPAPNSDEIGPQ